MADLIYCSTLREANKVRQAEWDSGGDITLGYAGNEFAGEVGEAIEASDDLSDTSSLADELADVVICCDLIALRRGFSRMRSSYAGKPPEAHQMGKTMLALAKHTGRACNSIKKLERERFGMPGSRSSDEELRNHLGMAEAACKMAAMIAGIDLDLAVADKFNKTSVKVGLLTRMVSQ